MKWLNSMKIRTKLLSSFLLIAVFTGIIGYMGISRLHLIEDADIVMYEKITVPLSDLMEMTTAFQRIRVNVRDAIFAKDLNEQKDRFNDIDKLVGYFNVSFNHVEVTTLTEKGKIEVKNVKKTFDDYLTSVPKIKDLLEIGKKEEALALMQGKMKSDNFLCQEALDILQASKVELAKQTSADNNVLAESSTLFLLILIVIVVIVSIVLGFVIAGNIQSIVKSVINTTNSLSEAAVQGRLSTRGEPEKINAEFRGIVVGINNTLDAVIGPLNVAAEYVDRISKGDIPPKIKENYNGDFNEIKNNLNILIDAMLQITDATKQMSEGNLDLKIDIRSEKDELSKALSEMIKVNTQIVSDIKRIATGDLTIQLKPRSDKDGLLLALSSMVTQLEEIVRQVNMAAQNVADGSSAISASSQQMSQGANEQASSVEEVSSSIEEMSSIIEQNTDNAQQTEKISLKAATDIAEGNKAVEVTISAMKEIAEKIVVITSIAQKTDILAINAAIEAARAGEHGEGFAVVAAEVRKLAELSQAAAKEITQTAQSSVQVAVKSGELLKSIVPDIQNTAKLVQEIAAASMEQKSGTTQINGAINQLNTIAQQNASSAEELSSSSEQLSSMAEQLKDVISYFKTNEEVTTLRRKQIKEPRKQSTPVSRLTGGAHIKLAEKIDNDDAFETY